MSFFDCPIGQQLWAAAMRTNLVLTTLVILAYGYGLLAAQSGHSEDERSHGALFLVGAHNAVRIDLQTRTTKVWHLLTQVGMKEADICSARQPPLSCDWYASETLLDLRNQRLYLRAPTTPPGDATGGDDEKGPFAVWVLDLESMKLLKTLDVSAEAMILAPDGSQLLVTHSPGQTVDTFDTKTFAKVSSVQNVRSDLLDTYLTVGSYFLPDGKFIILGGQSAVARIHVEAGLFKQEVVDPRAQLSPHDLKDLSGFTKTDKLGQKVLVTVSVSSRNGKTLVSVANEGASQAAFWTVDMETGATSHPIVLNYLAKAELIQSGDEFAVFEGHFSQLQ